MKNFFIAMLCVATVMLSAAPKDNISPMFKEIHGIRDFKVVNNSVSGIIFDKDPYFITLKDFSVNADKYKQIIFTFKAENPKRDYLQFFWKHKGEGYSEKNSTAVWIDPNTPEHEYILDLSRNSNWKGEIVGLRIDPMANSKGNPAYSFSFSNFRVTMFRKGEGIRDFKTVNDSVSGIIFDKDPFFVTSYSTDADKYKRIKFSFKAENPKRDYLQIFWIHKGEGYSEKNSTAVWIDPNTPEREYVLDLSRNSNWKGEIVEFRIDPMANSKGNPAYPFSLSNFRVE